MQREIKFNLHNPSFASGIKNNLSWVLTRGALRQVFVIQASVCFVG